MIYHLITPTPNTHFIVLRSSFLGIEREREGGAASFTLILFLLLCVCLYILMSLPLGAT